MRRFLLLLLNEFKLTRTAIPIHAVAIIEPVIMYALMTVILVHPTVNIHVAHSTSQSGKALVAAMLKVGSPIGLPYINPVLVDTAEPLNMRQVISIEEQNHRAIAVQRFNLIDNNLVKNYRNRLTAAAIILWNDALGGAAVTVIEHPTQPKDIPYNIYFGMAMLPLTAFLAAVLVGSVITAQEFELRTVLEYRLAITSPGLLLTARLTRLALTGLIASAALMLTISLINRYWLSGMGWICLVLLPISLIAGCLGIIAGLIFRRTLPAFVVSLVAAFFAWLLGDAFKPAASIGGWYEFFSRLTPNSYAVELLFPFFYGIEIGPVYMAATVLFITTIAMIALTLMIYQRRFAAQ